jgi:hypothetical protein
MDDVVAKSHTSERSRLAWRAKSFFVVLKNLLDLLSDNQVIRVGLAID